MTAFLLDHLPNCSPLKPCASCEAVVFLRDKLTDEDMQTFLEYVRRASAELSGVSLDSPLPLDTPITILGPFPARVMNILRDHNIGTIGELLKMTESELRTIPNFGRKSRTILIKALNKVGRHLGEISK